jgi:hypothetical protein
VLIAAVLFAFAIWFAVIPYASTGLASGSPVNCGSAVFTMSDRVEGAQLEAGCRATSRVRAQRALILSSLGGALLISVFGLPARRDDHGLWW